MSSRSIFSSEHVMRGWRQDRQKLEAGPIETAIHSHSAPYYRVNVNGLMVPTFAYTRDKEDWERLYAHLLLVWGPPPDGCLKKFEHENDNYPRVKASHRDGRRWEWIVLNDIIGAASAAMSPRYRANFIENQARHMKNKFLLWCWENMQ